MSALAQSLQIRRYLTIQIRRYFNKRLGHISRADIGRHCWWIAIVGLTLVRFVLTAKDEVVYMDGDPVNYARLAMYYFSGGPLDVLPAQRPGIGLMAQISANVGVPYKLLLDGLFIATIYLVASRTRRWTGSLFIGLSVFVILIFNPWFILKAQMFESEPVAALFILAIVVGSEGLICRPIRHWSLGDLTLGVVAAIGLVLVRPEEPIVYSVTLLILVLALIVHARSCRSLTWGRRLTCVGMALLPALATWGTIAVWERVHAHHFGLGAMAKTEAPGLKALLNRLYEIQPEQEIRFAPVTRETLAQACDQSVTLARRRDQLLDETRVNYRQAESRLGLLGEVGTWLNWHLVNCFAGTHVEADGEMRRAAEEIELALAEGHLPRRLARYPIDPLWREWLPDLWPEFRRALAGSFVPRLNPMLRLNEPRKQSVNVVERGDYDDGLLRRRGTRADRELRIVGYTTANHLQYLSVQVLDHTGEVLGNVGITPRPSGGMQFEQVINVGLYFDCSEVTLQFLAAVQPGDRLPSQSIPLNAKWARFKIAPDERIEPSGSNPASWSVMASLTNTRSGWRERWQTYLNSVYAFAWAAAGAVAFFIATFHGSPIIRPGPLLGLLLVGWGLLLGRSLFYALLEVWLKWGIGRYVGPQTLLAIWLVILTSFFVGTMVRAAALALFRKSRKETALHA